jgi:hypothetical protein
MDDAVHDALAAWANFYLITGTAAAALTGLQFVVQTLMAAEGRSEVVAADPEGGTAAFGTPTVVHFSIALVLSALLSAPWPGFGTLRTTLAVLGTGALVYAAIVLRRARSHRVYKPVAEDWIFHIVLPTVAYGAVLVSAMLFGDGDGVPLSVIAGATLLLLCVGIHNAWDTVTYLTLQAIHRANPEHEPGPQRQTAPRTRGRRRR